MSAALTGGSASLARVAEGTAVDAGGLIPDLVAHNSWVATVGEVDPVELLEVQLCNSVAPFILVNRLRPAMEASKFRRKYIVNVSAMEGVFGRGYKGPGHPHTNMAKAALNMLTRTSSGELREKGILMTAVDTGWITDERPHVTKERLAGGLPRAAGSSTAPSGTTPSSPARPAARSTQGLPQDYGRRLVEQAGRLIARLAANCTGVAACRGRDPSAP